MINVVSSLGILGVLMLLASMIATSRRGPAMVIVAAVIGGWIPNEVGTGTNYQALLILIPAVLLWRSQTAIAMAGSAHRLAFVSPGQVCIPSSELDRAPDFDRFADHGGLVYLGTVRDYSFGSPAVVISSFMSRTGFIFTLAEVARLTFGHRALLERRNPIPDSNEANSTS